MPKNDKKETAKKAGEFTGYCMTCRKSNKMKDEKLVTMKKGDTTRYMMKGLCTQCGGKMSAFIAKP